MAGDNACPEHVYWTCVHGMCMTNVTITVPEDLKRKMEKANGINWSSVARKAFEEAILKKEMSKAAEEIDRLRASSKSLGWSGAKEIRRWRDASKKSS